MNRAVLEPLAVKAARVDLAWPLAALPAQDLVLAMAAQVAPEAPPTIHRLRLAGKMPRLCEVAFLHLADGPVLEMAPVV